MKIKVFAHTNSKNPRVVQLTPDVLDIYLNVVPEKGKANQAIITILSSHFKTAKSNIILLKGQKTKSKFFEVLL